MWRDPLQTHWHWRGTLKHPAMSVWKSSQWMRLHLPMLCLQGFALRYQMKRLWGNQSNVQLTALAWVFELLKPFHSRFACFHRREAEMLCSSKWSTPDRSQGMGLEQNDSKAQVHWSKIEYQEIWLELKSDNVHRPYWLQTAALSAQHSEWVWPLGESIPNSLQRKVWGYQNREKWAFLVKKEEEIEEWTKGKI